MTEFDFLYLLERYGTDTALAALFVVWCDCLLKKTVLKNCLNKPIVSLLRLLFCVTLFFAVQNFLQAALGAD